MTDMSSIVNTVTRVAFLLMSASLFIWAFAPQHRPVSLGFLLGVLTGLINIRYLALKIRQITESVANRQRRRLSLGFVTRLCLGLLVIMVAVKFDEVSLGATIAGLFIMPVLLIPVSILLSIRQ